ncbi:MAG: GWxTD domain-containing protein [Acidobacteriia bacterium]|nr:GWxTD domain-containing protein [Terriglobia bacterium]
MNQLEAWIHTPFAKTLGWSLIHFLWEGVVIALFLAAVLFLCRPREARLRYALSSLALVAMAAAFALTLVLLLPSHRAGLPVAVPVPLTPFGPLPVGPPPAAWSWPMILASVLPWVAPFWMAGVFLFYLRSLGSWMVAQRLRRTGVCAASGDWQDRLHRLRNRLQLSAPVVLLESCLIDVPVVMGFLRPVILMPVGLLAGLSTDQLESILIHELAHIRRWDYVVNLLQNLVEGLLFYHPAVWWVSGQVRAERENCCDDVVVKLKGDARGYAAVLATLEENRWPAREPVLAATGGSLMKRIRRLLQEPEGPRASAAPVLAAGLLVVSLGVAVAGWQTKPTPAPKPAVSPLLTQEKLPETAPVGASPREKATPRPLLAQVRPASEQSQTTNPLRFQQLKKDAEQRRSGSETPYQKWLNEDVAYIISDRERVAFKNLQTDEEREKFIEQFWLRRDPTPGTPQNEFKDEHYRRIAYANQHFASQIPGWMTDRGRIYITYGPPDEIESHPSGGAYRRPPEQGGDTITTVPFEQWRYRLLEGIGNDIIIEFADPNKSGEYRMTSDPTDKDASRIEGYVAGVTSAAAAIGGARVKTGATVQVMSTAAAGGKTVLISIPLNAYGNHAVNVLATITSAEKRPVSTFEQSVPGPAPLYTRFIALPPGSYRLNVVVKDVATGALASDEIAFYVK